MINGVLLATYGLVLVATFGTGAAHANHIQKDIPYYNVCIQAGSDGTNESGMTVKLKGTSGVTDYVLLDNRADHEKDDFNGNKLSCFELSTRQIGMKDIGPILSLTLKADLSDDFCYTNVLVERGVNGKVSLGPNNVWHRSQFPNTGCLGNNPNPDVTIANMDTTTKNLTFLRQPPKGRWVDAGSGGVSIGLEHTITMTKGFGSTLSKEQTNTVTAAIEQKSEFVGLGEVTAKLEASRTFTETNTETKNEESGFSSKTTCVGNFSSSKLPAIWQWEESVVANSFSVTVLSCHFACTFDSSTLPSGKGGDHDMALSCREDYVPSDSCDNLANSRQDSTGSNVNFVFTNNFSEVRKLSWIDTAGNPIFFADIAPGAYTTIGTQTSHPWLITDVRGNCKGVVKPDGASKSYTITK